MFVWYQKNLEEEDGRDSLYTFLSRIDINFPLQFFTNELMPLTLSTNSTNYIKQFDISW